MYCINTQVFTLQHFNQWLFMQFNNIISYKNVIRNTYNIGSLANVAKCILKLKIFVHRRTLYNYWIFTISSFYIPNIFYQNPNWNRY